MATEDQSTPWKQTGLHIDLEDGSYIVARGVNAAAHIRRIVACVNALHGMPTDMIEQVGGIVAPARINYRTMENQRNALAEALINLPLTCSLDRLNPCWDNRPTDVPGKHWGVGDACPQCTARGTLSKVLT